MSRGLRTGAVLLGLALLAFWMTWPWARDLTTSAYDPGGVSALYPHFVHPDIHLNVWIVGWVARTLPTVPGRLYDAGIYYPVRYPFAYSEHMLGGERIKTFRAVQSAFEFGDVSQVVEGERIIRVDQVGLVEQLLGFFIVMFLNRFYTLAIKFLDRSLGGAFREGNLHVRCCEGGG